MLTKTAQRYFIFTCRCIATYCQFLLLRGHLLVQDVYSSAEQSLATGKRSHDCIPAIEEVSLPPTERGPNPNLLWFIDFFSKLKIKGMVPNLIYNK